MINNQIKFFLPLLTNMTSQVFCLKEKERTEKEEQNHSPYQKYRSYASFDKVVNEDNIQSTTDNSYGMISVIILME